MKEYKITKGSPSVKSWDDVPKAHIDTYKWMNNGYEPRSFSQLMYDSDSIYVKHTSFEPEITICHTSFQGDVYKDSCMEFFLMPAGDERYMNFETNAMGVLLLHFGTTNDRTPIDSINPDIFCFTPSVQNAAEYRGDKWTLEYKIPFDFLHSLYGDIELKKGFYGNFYKCGDETSFEHYGMWNEVENSTPQFHLPQYFGKLWFEN